MRLQTIATIALSMTLAVAAVGQNGKSQHGFDRASLDETCAPCQDFYGSVNGG